MAFCHRLLNEIGVAITPGIDFETAEGHLFVRLSFGRAPEKVTTALQRLESRF